MEQHILGKGIPRYPESCVILTKTRSLAALNSSICMGRFSSYGTSFAVPVDVQHFGLYGISIKRGLGRITLDPPDTFHVWVIRCLSNMATALSV
jgi:hypothetical protein